MASPKFTSPISGLQVAFVVEGSLAAMECSGVVEVEDSADRLTSALLSLHADLLDANVRAVRVDFKKLSYMNSGGIKAFASWFTRAENGGKPAYAIEAHYDPGSTWQGWSLGVLQRMAPHAVKLHPPRRIGAP